MLDRVLAPLSLDLYAADGESGVSVLMNGNELLTMAQKGDAVQFSCMPNVSYASLDGNALELLLGTTSDSLDLRAVDGTFEKWIDDGWVLSNAILEPFAEYGKRKSVKTTIKDMGLARSCTDYTFSKSKLEEMQQTLLSLCPEGDLHDLIASLTFSGTQNCASIAQRTKYRCVWSTTAFAAWMASCARSSSSGAQSERAARRAMKSR